LLLLLLAGCGREGDAKDNLAAARSRGVRGSSSALVLWRGSGWSPMEAVAQLPWWKRPHGAPVARPPNNSKRRCCFLPGDGASLSLLPAGLGGKGEEGAIDVFVPTRKRWWGSLVSAISAAASKQRRLAAAISGQLIGPAALNQGSCSSFFLLRWRIFGSDATEFDLVSGAPSGCVPGGDGNGCIWKPGGGAQGLDCVLQVNAILCRVQSKNIKGMCVYRGAA